MEIIKCPNCGAQSFKKDENNTLTCNYCGSRIIRKSNEAQETPRVAPIEYTGSHYRPNANFFTERICPRCGGKLKEDFNTFLFIVLLIIFWPIGVIYLFIPKKKKCIKCDYIKDNH